MKIKLVHLLFNPEYDGGIEAEKWDSVLDKQKKSIECFEKIKHKFSAYTQLYSNVNRDELPIESCADKTIIKHIIPKDHIGPVLSYGHYGAYMAHRRGATQEFGDEYDAILIIEADVVTNLTPDNFFNSVKTAYELCENNDGRLVTLAGPKFGVTTYNVNEYIVDYGEWIKVPHFVMGSAYLIHKSEKNNIKEKYYTNGWHTPDIWLYWNYDRRVNIFSSKEPLVYQCEGFSAIDNNHKGLN